MAGPTACTVIIIILNCNWMRQAWQHCLEYVNCNYIIEQDICWPIMKMLIKWIGWSQLSSICNLLDNWCYEDRTIGVTRMGQYFNYGCSGLQIWREWLLTHTITHASVKSGERNTAHLNLVRFFINCKFIGFIQFSSTMVSDHSPHHFEVSFI